MDELLRYLKKHSKQQPIHVIIDDISRLARGLNAHIQLRSAIGAAGGILVSPSIEFGDDSDSMLIENLLASVSQHARQKNTEQVIHRMRARVMSGYWCFCPIVGYKYEEVEGHGKILVRVEPVASIIAEALNGFASGRFETIVEVKRFLNAQPAYPKGKDGKVHFQRVQELCTRALYAGYMDVPKWGLSLHPAKHKPLISFETYQKIQTRLNRNPKAPARADISEDFPLRGFIKCGCCNHPMSSAWTQGRNKKYPYYFCQTKSCDQHRKSIKRELIEGEFETLLKNLRPAQNLFKMAYEMLSDLWQHQEDLSKEQIKIAKVELVKIERQSEKMIDKIVETDNDDLISAYEKKIRKLATEKLVLSEKIQNFGQPITNFKETYRTAMSFLSNPYKLWASKRIEDRRLVLRMTFSDQLSYDRNQGYRTADLSLPFKMLDDALTSNKVMVGPVGLEPTTDPL